MRINWKRFLNGAFLLASLSLLLFGCSDLGGSQKAQDADTKSISGIVSDTEKGLPLPGAKVTAYAIDDNGVASTTPLSKFSVFSDLRGAYTLQIPADFSNSVLIVAEPDGRLPKQTGKVSKAAALQAPAVIRSVVAKSLVSNDTIPPVMVSFATDTVYAFVKKNQAGGFTPDNIKSANLVLEVFFGPNFSQVEPPKSATDTDTTQAQQDLIVSIQALNTVIASQEVASIDTIVSGLYSGGLGDVAQSITTAINTAVTSLATQGTLPQGYVASPVIVAAITETQSAPVAAPNLSDTTAPSAPGSLAASLTSGKITLSWGASVDSGSGATGVSGYLIYRADSSNVYVNINTVGKDAVSYIDASIAAQTTYSYKVVAYDAARNFSPASNISNSVTTPAGGYTISGRVTLDGVGLAGVVVTKGSSSVVTDSFGNYSFTGVTNGSYVLTPSFFSFYRFTPETLTATVSNANLTGQNFTSIFSGTIIGGVAYPEGTIVGGITYPTGTVIGGVTYPTATVIGGVTYPTGAVTGGVLYPDGVVIGGVSYPAGTVVGGIAFPVGAVTGDVNYPSGTVIGGTVFPTGSVTAAEIDWSLSGTPSDTSNPPPTGQ